MTAEELIKTLECLPADALIGVECWAEGDVYYRKADMLLSTDSIEHYDYLGEDQNGVPQYAIRELEGYILT